MITPARVKLLCKFYLVGVHSVKNNSKQAKASEGIKHLRDLLLEDHDRSAKLSLYDMIGTSRLPPNSDDLPEEGRRNIQFGRKQRTTMHPPKNMESLFNNSKRRLNIFNPSQLEKKNLQFWLSFDNEKTRITNQEMGAKNAFEEQIEWTKQGRMWQYPIDNEYMLGNETNVSFVDHIFLEAYCNKNRIPKSKAVEHFMELVLVGLSKNPYMSIEKKREHVDWFSNYFKQSMDGKYKEVL